MKTRFRTVLYGVLATLAMGSASATTYTGTITRINVNHSNGTTFFMMSTGVAFVIDPTQVPAGQYLPLIEMAMGAWNSGKSVIVTNDNGPCLGYCALKITSNPAF